MSDEKYSAIDFSVLAELDDNEAALELVDMYSEETEGVYKFLKAKKEEVISGEGGTPEQQWSQIWAYLHKLKGSSLSIGLTGVATYIEDLRGSDASTLATWYPDSLASLEKFVNAGLSKITAQLGQ